MKRERNRYDGALKAKVALEALKGQRTTHELAAAYGVHPNMVTQWKKQAGQQLPEIFSGNVPAGSKRTSNCGISCTSRSAS